jgi:hypothetical protein
MSRITNFLNDNPELGVAIFGLSGIIFLESLALFKGVDGTMFGLAIAGVGTIIGYIFKGFYQKIKKRKS